MKKERFPLLFVILIIVFVSCKQEYEDVVFLRVRKVEFKDISQGKIIATADAVFDNPNKKGGKVSKIDVDISINGEAAAKITRNESFKISGNSEFTIPLDMEIDAANFTKNVLGNLFSSGKEKSIPLDFDGNIWISVYGVPKKVPVKYKSELNFRL